MLWAAQRMKREKIGVNKVVWSIKTAKTGVNSSTETGKCRGQNSCKLTKMSKIWDKMGNPMPVERVMWPNRKNMENYGDLQPCAGVAEGGQNWPNHLSRTSSLIINGKIFVFCIMCPWWKQFFGLLHDIDIGLTFKNLRGVKMTPMFFWNNSRKREGFSTKFQLSLDYDIKE